MRSISNALGVSFSTFVLFACSGDEVAGPDSAEEARLPEQRGVPLTGPTEVANNSNLAWSPDGGTIFYARRFGGIGAVDVATGTTRLLHEQTPRELAVSGDGGKVFFVATNETMDAGLYMTSPDGQQTFRLATNVRLWQLSVSPFVLSPDNTHVAYSVSWPCENGCDSLFVHNVVDDTRVFYGRSASILTFSPDGSRLLCEEPAEGGPPQQYQHFIIDLKTGEKEPVSLSTTPTISGFELVRWDQTGIRVLYRSGLSGVFVYNAPDGAASSILDLDGYYPLIHDWSGDGSKIAYSNSRCVEGVGLFSCDVSEWVLRVVDIERRRDQSAAVIHSIYSERGTSPGFSPDGNRIAYVFDGRIYLTDSLQD